MTNTFNKAFTTRIPLAVMIVTGIKRWENRSCFPEPSRGRCGMSCSKGSDEREYANFLSWAERKLGIRNSELGISGGITSILPTWEQGKLGIRNSELGISGGITSILPTWEQVKDWRGKMIAVMDYEAQNAPSALNGPAALNEPAVLNAPAALNSNGGDSRRCGVTPPYRGGDSRAVRGSAPTGGFEITEEMLAWYEGYDVWWRLSNVEMLDEPFPVRGNVGMWDFCAD